MFDKDEIIEMARKFGLSVGVALNGSRSMGKHEDKSFAVGRLPLEDFVAFVKLVADVATAKEREEIAQMCDSASETTKDAKTQLRQDEFIAHGVAAGSIHQAERLAKAIRARGEA